MKIYLAGKMRHRPYFNYPAFHAAAAKLRAEGHVVFSPAERDIERCRFDLSKDNPTGDPEKAERAGFDLRAAIADDLEFITRHAEAIALLPDWQSSKGVALELAAAQFCGLKVIGICGDCGRLMDGPNDRVDRGLCWACYCDDQYGPKPDDDEDAEAAE